MSLAHFYNYTVLVIYIYEQNVIYMCPYMMLPKYPRNSF